MESIWIKTAPQKPSFQKLNGDIKTDVLIIGGGITGLLCAYMLKKASVPCIVAEADKICSGITKNTTAKITLQHGLIYDNLINKFGMEKARMYLDAQLKAAKMYKELSKNISCDYVLEPSIVYSLNDCRKIEKEISALNKLGLYSRFVSTVPLPFKIAGGVEIKEQAQFHPLKFLYEISRDLEIYENTRIIEIKNNKAITENGIISCKKIIVATHFPFINKYGGYFLKMYQHRSYVIALENGADVKGMYVDEDEKGLSFRNYNGMLLLGGGSHRTGKKGGNWEELKQFAEQYYPDKKVVSQWATQDCMSLDQIAYIGQYSKKTPDLFVATGFNKWGMTSAMTAAMILTDLVQGKHNEYAAVFSPGRSILRPQLFVNGFESLAGLITPTAPRCPHLGCALKYNKQEHSWDCSCHGSRFNEQGDLIDNPATKDKKL